MGENLSLGTKHMTTKVPDHDLNHEVYIDPKDHKEHVNHGMIEYYLSSKNRQLSDQSTKENWILILLN